MSEMVERVARALWEVELDKQNCGWEAANPFRREQYLRDARAAIAAMREPDALMVFKGFTAEPIPSMRAGPTHYRAAWRAMVDEALK